MATPPAPHNGDPKLGPLQDNGGPTQTMALGAGSAARDAAVDAGAAPPVNNLDQRGLSRPKGAHGDIGRLRRRRRRRWSASATKRTCGSTYK